MSIRVSTFASIAAFALCACSADAPTPVLETVAPAALVISVDATGELKSSKATPLMVPGRNWSSRRLVWMAPEGSLVKKGEVIARFSAEEGEQELALALIDLQRNALARAAKEGELEAGRGRVDVDLAKVGTDLGIARRYADADLGTMARNDVLDALQDARFLDAKQGALHCAVFAQVVNHLVHDRSRNGKAVTRERTRL